MNYSIMNLLKNLLKNDLDSSYKSSLFYPTFRLLGCLLIIFLVVLSKNILFIYTMLAIVCIKLALLNPNNLLVVLKRIIPILLLSTILLLPSVVMGNSSSLVIILKVFITISLIHLLNVDVSWKEITSCLYRLHFPPMIIFIIDMSIQFLVILGNYSNRLIEAVELRSVGRKSWRDSQLGGILGTTFLKSNQMSDQISEAMICRGFNGIYKTYDDRKIKMIDYYYLIVLFIIMLYFLWTEGIL